MDPMAPAPAPVLRDVGPSLPSLVASMADSSDVSTAATITFLIRFSSLVKVKSASLELFSKF